MVKQDERQKTNPQPENAALDQAVRAAERSMAPTEPFDPATTSGLRSYPPADQWNSWDEYDPRAWPERVRCN